MLTKVVLGCITFAFIVSLSLVIIGILNDAYTNRIQYLRSKDPLFKEYFQRRSVLLTILYFVSVIYLGIISLSMIFCIIPSSMVISYVVLLQTVFFIGLYIYCLYKLKTKAKNFKKGGMLNAN